MKGKLSNGRSTYEELKAKYKRVYIRHVHQDSGTTKTICLLVNDGEVHVGLSKFSNRGATFHKRKGRIIAQGRAELAASVSTGETHARVGTQKRREELSFTVNASELSSVEEIIKNLLGTNEAIVR